MLDRRFSTTWRSSAEELRTVLTALARKHRVPGAQLAVRSGGETLVVQTGVEREGRPRRMRASSKVPVGSITKAFTATVAMMLVADDDLELDAPISEVLPKVPGADALTLRRLLSHTAGLPCDPAEETASRLRNQDLAEPVCPPGTAFSYSNLGYALVGRVIEAVVGMPWREAVDAILLRPLGIDPVFVGDALSVSGHTAAGQPVGQLLAPILEPVGGLALSAADLAAFGRVHLGKPGLLDVVTASEMHTPVPVAEPVGLADGWGLGLAIFGGDGVDWLGHDGTADGTSCHLRIDQAGACVIALTANSVNGTALWRELIDELRLRGVPITRYRACPEQASRIDLPARYHGTYRNGAAEYTVTSDERGVPCLVADGEVFRDLTLYEGGAFTLAEPGTGEPADAGRFMRDAVLAGGRLARRA